MHLSAPCRSCGHAIPITPTAKSRLVLARTHGRTFDATCDRCRQPSTVHVDEVWATTERVEFLAIMAGVGVALVATMALLSQGWIATLPTMAGVGIYGAWTQDAAKRAAAFNQYKVGR